MKVTHLDYVRTSKIDNAYVENLISDIQLHFGHYFDGHGGKLIIETYNDPDVNLYAEQLGFSWFIHIYAGYIHLPGMTKDALALSVCHEVGHHLAGYPFKSSWSSAEGQADYFANHICTSILWEDEDKRVEAEEIPEPLDKLCQSNFSSSLQQNLCRRKVKAGIDLAQVMAEHSGTKIQSNLVDLKPTDKMIFSHPSAQCRLHNFIRSSLCKIEFDLNIIPGKKKATVVPVPRPARGYNNLAARKESQQYLCPTGIGARPRCWFK